MGALSFVGMAICMVATLAGIVILGGDIMDFVDIASLMLTIVPTAGALLATFPLSVLAKMTSHTKAIMSEPYNPEDYIDMIIDIAKQARSEGILAVEKKIDQCTNDFMKYGLRLVVDGADELYIKDSLSSYLDGLETRHNESIVIYEKGASYAPAFGMCATVISLVNMLMALDFTDPNAINALGGNMAAALITTFYGCLMANVYFLPIAGRLKMLHKREVFCKTMIADGILGIQKGDNPAKLQQMLMEQAGPMVGKKAEASPGEGAAL